MIKSENQLTLQKLKNKEQGPKSNPKLHVNLSCNKEFVKLWRFSFPSLLFSEKEENTLKEIQAF